MWTRLVPGHPDPAGLDLEVHQHRALQEQEADLANREIYIFF